MRLKILMVGQDDSIFPGSSSEGNTRQRLEVYLDALNRAAPGSSLVDLVYTPDAHEDDMPRPDMHFLAVRAPRIQLFPLAGYLKARRSRKYLQADLVSAQTPFESGLLGLALSRMLGKPLEVQVHLNLLSPYWLAEHRVVNRVRLLLARLVLRRAAGIRVVSSPVEAALVESWHIPKSRIRTIPIPAIFEAGEDAAPRAETWLQPGDDLALFVGRLCKAKNIPGLFEVISKVLESCPRAHFALVGDGPLEAYARQQAGRLDPHRVHLLGSLPHHELPQWYRLANVVVLPSLHEGFARVLQEGYLQGTPAVATRCGGPQDIILDGQTGFLTPIEDMDGFSKRVEWLLNNPKQAAEMGQRGQAYMREKFEPQELIEQIVSNWLELAQGYRAAR